MRTIKFRFWDKIEKEIISWEQISPLYKRYFNPKSDVIAMQFTGLKDKNGKEIYECDILKITLYDNEWITTVRDYYGTLVVDVEGCDWDTTALSFLDEDAETEVIGNIYNNPELLKK